ncbi:hypothetical protein [Nostoc sp.]
MPTVVTERLVSAVEPCRSAGYAYAFAVFNVAVYEKCDRTIP